MGRKRRTRADRAKLACANCYDDNQTFADDAEILKPMTDGSEDAYRDVLEIWAEDMYVEENDVVFIYE
ncbi:hypothetical protein OEA41_002145 [Lepraria neglecta]|uniref:Uncharacterized protein n=1 Tax=Lepraria neglecta TaxID=209136 RepID=A0AAE0DM06_9LECA|nr:hypothetical protein OEA41_002145 [Lepraria neglecta]